MSARTPTRSKSLLKKKKKAFKITHMHTDFQNVFQAISILFQIQLTNEVHSVFRLVTVLQSVCGSRETPARTPEADAGKSATSVINWPLTLKSVLKVYRLHSCRGGGGAGGGGGCVQNPARPCNSEGIYPVNRIKTGR